MVAGPLMRGLEDDGWGTVGLLLQRSAMDPTVLSPGSCVETLPSSRMVFGGGAFGSEVMGVGSVRGSVLTLSMCTPSKGM